MSIWDTQDTWKPPSFWAELKTALGLYSESTSKSELLGKAGSKSVLPETLSGANQSSPLWPKLTHTQTMLTQFAIVAATDSQFAIPTASFLGWRMIFLGGKHPPDLSQRVKEQRSGRSVKLMLRRSFVSFVQPEYVHAVH